jgi:hypothetical protein
MSLQCSIYFRATWVNTNPFQSIGCSFTANTAVGWAQMLSRWLVWTTPGDVDGILKMDNSCHDSVAAVFVSITDEFL